MKPFYNDCLCISCAVAILPFFSLTDKNFSDLFHDPKSPLPSADDLNRLLSNVPDHFDHDLDDTDNMFLTNNQLDSYLTVQEARKLLSGKNEECSFSTMCVNVGSLTNPHNFTKFESLILGLDYQSHIIAVNETWEKPHATGQHMNLNGYVYISNPRVVSRGGGVGMYIKQSLIFTPYAELSIMHEKLFESLFVTMHFEGKRLICGTVYRPPRNDNLGLSGFFDSIKLVLGELIKTQSKCFLMGNLYFNLLDFSDKKIEQFTDITFNYNFHPLINKPTRITDSSSSAIDYTWTNVSNTGIKSGIIAHCVADHLPVIHASNLGKIKTNLVSHVRWYAVSNLRKFSASLENADLCNAKNQDNPDNCFKNLYDLLLEEFENFILLKESSKTTKHSEWYDRELRRLMLKKDRLSKKYLLRRDLTSKNQYHKTRSMYFHLIQLKKIEFYQKNFKNFHNNVKKTWQYINKSSW